MFKISDLSVSGTNENSEAFPILRGINMEVLPGETHAIMGPNGSGKSTLARVIGGHPSYEITSGSINYELNLKSQNLLSMEPDERAKNGVFISFQYHVAYYFFNTLNSSRMKQHSL